MLFKHLEQESHVNPRLIRPRDSMPIATERAVAERNQRGERAEEIIQVIRRRAGFEHFLRGQPFAYLCKVAEASPVVVLLAHTRACEAVIIADALGTTKHVIFPELSLEYLEKISEALNANNLNLRGGVTDSEELKPSRGSGVRRGVQSNADALLNDLWTLVVRPVIDALGLKVNSLST